MPNCIWTSLHFVSILGSCALLFPNGVFRGELLPLYPPPSTQLSTIGLTWSHLSIRYPPGAYTIHSLLSRLVCVCANMANGISMDKRSLLLQLQYNTARMQSVRRQKLDLERKKDAFGQLQKRPPIHWPGRARRMRRTWWPSPYYYC